MRTCEGSTLATRRARRCVAVAVAVSPRETECLPWAHVPPAAGTERGESAGERHAAASARVLVGGAFRREIKSGERGKRRDCTVFVCCGL